MCPTPAWLGCTRVGRPALVLVAGLCCAVAAHAAGPAAPPALIAPESSSTRPADNPIDQSMVDMAHALERGDTAAALALVYVEPGTPEDKLVSAGLRYEAAAFALRKELQAKFPDAALPPMLRQPLTVDFLHAWVALSKQERPVKITGETAVTRRYFDPIDVSVVPNPELDKMVGAALYYRRVDGVWKLDASRTFAVKCSADATEPGQPAPTADDVMPLLGRFGAAVAQTKADLDAGKLASASDVADELNRRMDAVVAASKLRNITISQVPREPGDGDATKMTP